MTQKQKQRKNSKAKPPTLTQKADFQVRWNIKFVFFLFTSYIFGTGHNLCHFGTFIQCPQQPSGSLLCGFYVAVYILDVITEMTPLKRASVSILLSLLHLFLETDRFLPCILLKIVLCRISSLPKHRFILKD